MQAKGEHAKATGSPEDLHQQPSFSEVTVLTTAAAVPTCIYFKVLQFALDALV